MEDSPNCIFELPGFENKGGEYQDTNLTQLRLGFLFITIL
jgi:hypothetical protein